MRMWGDARALFNRERARKIAEEQRKQNDGGDESERA